MEEGVLTILQEKNHPRNWNELGSEMRPKQTGVLKNEPIYEFFHTLDDSLEVNPQSIAISVQPVSSFIPFHVHNYVEIIVPLVGECTIITKNDELKLKQNDLIIIGNHTIHRVEPIETDAIVVNLTLKDTAFNLSMRIEQPKKSPPCFFHCSQMKRRGRISIACFGRIKIQRFICC